ncbi:MAG: nucleotidyltransferase family protein [bacterium]
MGKGPTAGILVAAGSSERMGRPKQLLPFGGRAMLLRVLEQALASPLVQVVLVLGYEARKVKEALGVAIWDPRLEVLLNNDYTEGMASSIRIGLERIQGRFPSFMLLFADQPLLDAFTLEFLLEAFWASEKEICVPLARGKRAHPVIFGSRFYPSLMALRGDVGGRAILQAHPEEILEVEVPRPDLLLDVDSPEDLERLEEIRQRVENEMI